ncbi:MAG: DMT family transporter [Lachnospiraceae bacterium]|nr:DMT family transporter [Lachnospiraceae bacterium]
MEIKSVLFLLLAALIWGVAFVAQSMGMEYVGPYTFNAARFLLGGIVLLPLAVYRRTKYQRENSLKEADQKKRDRITLIGGICCGIAIFIASTLQQVGMQYTSVGKAGFITALYIVIVPFLGMFLGKKVPAVLWLGAVIATGGFYLLCITEGFVLNQGDLLIFLCAVSFSFHILIIDHFAPKADGVALSCLQFFFSGTVSVLPALWMEEITWISLWQAAMPIAYAGILSCGVAYTLQILGQVKVRPSLASLILSLEAVISVLAGWLILGEVLTLRQLIGCGLVFFAVIIAQRC